MGERDEQALVVYSTGASTAPVSGNATANSRAHGPRMEWGTLVKMAAALSAVGGLCLPLVGASTNAHYYGQWGLDPAMFPLATDMTFVRGYETLVESYAEAIVKVWRDHWTVLLGYGVLCVIALLAMVGWFIHRELIVDKLKVTDGVNRFLRLGFASLLAFALPTVAIPFGALTLLLVLALPLTAAQLHAKTRVERMLHRFDEGCEKASATLGAKCLRVMKEDEQVARGFAIGSSERHLAVFDPVARRVMLVEREGTSIIGVPRPVHAAVSNGQ